VSSTSSLSSVTSSISSSTSSTSSVSSVSSASSDQSSASSDLSSLSSDQSSGGSSASSDLSSGGSSNSSSTELPCCPECAFGRQVAVTLGGFINPIAVTLVDCPDCTDLSRTYYCDFVSGTASTPCIWQVTGPDTADCINGPMTVRVSVTCSLGVISWTVTVTDGSSNSLFFGANGSCSGGSLNILSAGNDFVCRVPYTSLTCSVSA